MRQGGGVSVMQWVRGSSTSWMGLGRTVGLALCLALVGSCNELAETDRASSFLVIERLTGGTEGDTAFQSDVQSDNGAVFEDQGTLSARLAPQGSGLVGEPHNAYVGQLYHDKPLPSRLRTDRWRRRTASLRGGDDVHGDRRRRIGLICARSPLGQAGAASSSTSGVAAARLLSPRSPRSRSSVATRPATRPPPRGEST